MKVILLSTSLRGTKQPPLTFILSIITFCFFITSCFESPTKNLQQETSNSKAFTDSVFTTGIEGPTIDKDDNLYIVNYHHEGSIGIIKKGDSVPQLFIDLPKGSIGNGIRFNDKNEMFVADYMGHNILKIDITTKKISVYAHDSLMNQPNDLTMMKNGIIFCSDPNWKNSTGNLWRINLDGRITLLEDSMGTTNGVEVNPKNNVLYVNESVQCIIWKYTIDEKGNISNKQKFIDFKDGGMDGMRCDSKGNLYVARYDKGVVLCINPQGKIIKEYKLHGQKPTNVTFNKDETKLFVTMQDMKWVEVIKL